MLKIGLIGCGFMGGMHAACYSVIEGAQLVAVADVREEKAKEIAGEGVQIFADGMSLIENADIDVIDICLPTYLHTEHAIAAMKKGRKVFLEKPACLTKEEGQILLKVQKETGAQLQVGQVIRFWNEYKWLKEVSDSGKYGKLLTAVFKRLSAYPTWAWNGWLHDPNKSGTVAQDMHIHDVDFVRYLLGEPDGFSAHATRDEKGIIEQIFTTFTYGNACVTVEACWDYPDAFPFEAGYRVKFEKATVVFGANGIVVYHKDGTVENVVLAPSFEGNNEIGGNISDLGGYYNELKYFVDMLNAGKTPEIAPLCEGVKSVNLVLDEIAYVGGVQK